MALTGESFDPERAHEVRLVNLLVTPDAVRPRARDLLETVMQHDHDTVAARVRLFDVGTAGESA
jgi:enoyl-CoA hydratase/carnithine racemase